MDRTIRPRRTAPAPILLATTAALLTALAAARPAGAQIIPVRTVPLATGGQFLVHPSERLGIGGVSLALDDADLDPFTNPAKASRTRVARFSGTPTYYSVADGNGSGRTLPVSLLLPSSGGWSGGVSVALQEIRGPDPRWWGRVGLAEPTVVDPLPTTWWPGPGAGTLDERSSPNVYLTGVVARELGGGWSVGAGLFRAELNALDGVEHLFSGSRSLEQDGEMTDVRLGVLRDTDDGGSLDLSLVHRRFDAGYRAEYLEWVVPDECLPDQPCGEWTLREEHNLDRTNTTGARAAWKRPLSGTPWTLGTALTVNHKDHPKIPNYRIMNIPRDPGTTWAWSAGFGLARSDEHGTYGIDVLYEPIRSETWAEAVEDLERADGSVLPAGERTVENDFDFGNVRMRLGASREIGPARAELGLEVHAVSYDLVQDDRVEQAVRYQDESWMEWTPTWGTSVGLGPVRLSYQGWLTSGTGLPGTRRDAFRGEAALDTAAPGIDFVPAPDGPLTLQETRITGHRLGVEVPLD